MRLRAYIAKVADHEGATHRYLFDARTRRGARRQARKWVAGTNWDATLVGIAPGWKPEVGHRRLLAVAGVTLGVAGITISALMIIGLSLAL